MPGRSRLQSPLVAVLTTAIAAAQSSWRDLTPAAQPARTGHAMAYDILNGRTVVFGGVRGALGTVGETSVWDGNAWTTPTLSLQPSPRANAAMAYDLDRGEVVLFGGETPTAQLGDTWTWNGTQWRQRVGGPPARAGAAMAFDLGRSRTVLFGGVAVNGADLADTFEWDGFQWLLRTPATSPPARSRHAMACDFQRGRTVMFGGRQASIDSNDTWEWDGVVWTSRATSVSPPARSGHALSYDLRSTLLFGSRDDLWSWDGTAWQNITPTTGPRPTSSPACAMVYDLVRARTVMHGPAGNSNDPQTCEWDGATWWLLLDSQPSARHEARMVLDEGRGRVLLFGGQAGSTSPLDATWERNAGRWNHLVSAHLPPTRTGALAYDSLRQVAAFYSGNDLWEWDRVDWSQRTPANQPSNRLEAAMSYDAARQRVVMFGGLVLQLFAPASDTWTWDGVNWTQQQPANAPPARRGAAMTYDSARQLVVLFGGTPASTLTDTWEWDGTTWIARQVASAPAPRTAAAFVYDPVRRRSVLFGGNALVSFYSPLADTWEWDGGAWLQRAPATPPTARLGAAAAFDPLSGRIVMFGGMNTVGAATAETWTYGADVPAALAAFGSACAGSVGPAALRAVDGSLPWLGDTLALAVEPTPVNAAVLLAIGFSCTTFGGASLPASLDPIGMIACTQFVSIDELRVAFANGARADFALQVPTTTALASVQFFAQAAIADAAANPAGLVASNALAGRIGAR